MTEEKSARGGFALAATVVAGVYAYFLIFPQFAFLHSLRTAGVSPDSVRAYMGLMAAGGIAASLAAGLGSSARVFRVRLAVGALMGAVAALAFAAIPASPVLCAVVALMSGVALGLMTVALASSLRGLAGPGRVAAACGVGTGLAYAVSNFPPLFNAPPGTQSAVSAGFAAVVFIGALLSRAESPASSVAPAASLGRRGFGWGLLVFLLLIWLDSACFAVIQETEAMRSVSWSSDRDLILNAIVHALAAFVTGAFYRARTLAWLSLALLFLVSAAALLILGGDVASRAHLLYAAGVSVYSTLLVAWLPCAHGDGCSGRVAWLYSVAGWIGSALGVGMALDLHRIPAAFPAMAVGLLIGAWWLRADRLMDGGRA